MPCPDDSGNIYGKGVGTRNIMKHLGTNSDEHLHLILDLPPSFVTLRFNENLGKQIHLPQAKETHSTPPDKSWNLKFPSFILFT